ncbi:MAG: DUF2723 domain-containing protein [Gemmatimonadota bacterium]|nr:DUF2723 domain-containing protein [Gemmatimonadota bacterium]
MTDSRPPYGSAALMALAVLVLYVVTLAPTTAFWDTSEYIATGYILGIPHPPGNPLFVMLARTWALLLAPTGLSPAVRINLFAAVTSAASAGLWFLVAHRLLLPVLRDDRRAKLGAVAAAVLSATAYTVWNQSNVNEKVYTVSTLIIAWVTWLALRWHDRRSEPGSERYLVGILYLLVLGSTNHMMSVLPLPAGLLLIALTMPAVLTRPLFWARALPAVVLALSVNFFLPIRSAQDPIINEGEPSCESVAGAAVAVYTNGKAGCPALADNLQRVQYAKPPISQRNAPFSHQLLNYFQYFDWQWARGLDASDLPGSRRLPVTLLMLVLGGFGLWTLWRADRRLFAYMATLTGTLTVALVFYLNFKFGYSLAPEVTDLNLHEVRERDYFFVASFSLWGVLVGLGLSGVWRLLGERRSTGPASWAAAPVLVVAVLPLVMNWTWASRAGDYAARDWAHDLLMSVEPYGVLFTNGDNDTFPLWYAQEVEGIRKDVTVVVVQYLFTSWYPKQLQRHSAPARQRAFEPGAADGVYDASAVALPDAPILSLPPEDMDRVQGGPVPQNFVMGLGPVAVSYEAGTFLNRGQLLSLFIIRDSLGKRPIYFASSAGLMGQLGLDQWAVRHGLAVKLDPRRPDADPEPDLVELPPQMGGGRVNVPASLRLAEDVLSARSLGDRELWQDRATLNIPLQYYIFYAQLAEGAARAGLPEAQVEALREKGDAFLSTWETGRNRIGAGGG